MIIASQTCDKVKMLLITKTSYDNLTTTPYSTMKVMTNLRSKMSSLNICKQKQSL